DFPAEIRAPAGTLPGVSAFQLHFGDHAVLTPGDHADVLVAMNPAALKANLGQLRRGGTIIVNSDEFTARNLKKVGYAESPLEDSTLAGYDVHALALTSMAVKSVEGLDVGRKDGERAKNMFSLGLLSWLYSRPTDSTVTYIEERFAKKPELAAANIAAFKAGWNFGETTEGFVVRYEVNPAPMPAGVYRTIHGNVALAYGLIAGARQAGLQLFLGSYPITPASDILHELAKHKQFGVVTFQAEDEIAGVGAALGAAFGGALGVTTTSGPGVDLKAETVGLGVMMELPLILCDIQRAGPSTGMPTKTEQTDLLLAMFGRHGEAPVPIIAAQSPADCFDAAIEAVRIATTYRTPVYLLSDAYLANGSEPWLIPDATKLPEMKVEFAKAPAEGETFLPYARDPETLARPWAIPGTPGLEHRIGGIEKADGTGDISYDPANHDTMVRLRQAKIDGIAASIPELEVDDPDGDAKLLVLGWGSTYGPIAAAVRAARDNGHKVARAHLRHLNPLPANTGDVVRGYDKVLLPEMNLGQLALLLRAKFLVDIVSYNQVRGLPFRSEDLLEAITGMVS
ncbi:MAG TPA: 2-oxoacid:acceptor oxidoreductase subunit alpha, partial [Mycobacteriales bacterium]|nr:2-oxoacid:acceptor oxidoreductase subunit alpha [Mycobacteriales bacterium]